MFMILGQCFTIYTMVTFARPTHSQLTYSRFAYNTLKYYTLNILNTPMDFIMIFSYPVPPENLSSCQGLGKIPGTFKQSLYLSFRVAYLTNSMLPLPLHNI